MSVGAGSRERISRFRPSGHGGAALRPSWSMALPARCCIFHSPRLPRISRSSSVFLIQSRAVPHRVCRWSVADGVHHSGFRWKEGGYVVQRAKWNERWTRSFTRDSFDRGLHGLCRRRRLGRPWGPDHYRIRSNCGFAARGPSDGGVARSGRNLGDHASNQRCRGVYAGGAASGRVLHQRDSANVSQRVRRHRKRGGVADSRGVDLVGELGDCVGRDGAVLADST